MQNPLSERYRARLQSIPAPGTGCHVGLLSVANYGVMAGVDPEKLFADIRQAIPAGERRVPDKEINEAIRRAIADHIGGTFTPQPRSRPIVQDGKSVLQKIISEGKIHTEVDLWESSPIRLWNEPKDDLVMLLDTLFIPSDYVYIGERDAPGILGDTIRKAATWISYFQNGGKTSPHIILNPLTGRPALKKSGEGETFRGDGNIVEYRYCLIEFDDLPREHQIKFWSSINLPLVALIDSGGRSIHGWVDVRGLAEVDTPEQWAAEIRGRLYDRILTPLGVDGACSNPARLSRLPGHYRKEKGNFQRLLWLAKEGREIL